MSKIDKLKIRLLSIPKDFTYSEVRTLLNRNLYGKIEGIADLVIATQYQHGTWYRTRYRFLCTEKLHGNKLQILHNKRLYY